jgi:predicted transcriptional regulator
LAQARRSLRNIPRRIADELIVVGKSMSANLPFGSIDVGRLCPHLDHLTTDLESIVADENSTNLVELATELTIAWLSNPNNRAVADDVPAFLQKMHSTVSELASGMLASGAGTADQDAGPAYVPAVTARKSLASKDHIISMIDGKPYKTLRRHLSKHGLTPTDYRQRYNLKADYPMVAESYSETRRAMAKKIGLGNKGRQARAAGASDTAPGQAEQKKDSAARGTRKPRAKADA